MEGHEGWTGLKTVFAIRRTVVSKGKTTDEIRYYITDANVSAEELPRIVREHWKIECTHWILDVVFSEDKCAIVSENGHKILNILRKLALLIHKRYIASLSKKITIKASLLKCLMDDESLLQVKIKPVKISGQFLAEFFDENKSTEEIEEIITEALKMYLNKQ